MSTYSMQPIHASSTSNELDWSQHVLFQVQGHFLHESCQCPPQMISAVRRCSGQHPNKADCVLASSAIECPTVHANRFTLFARIFTGSSLVFVFVGWCCLFGCGFVLFSKAGGKTPASNSRFTPFLLSHSSRVDRPCPVLARQCRKKNLAEFVAGTLRASRTPQKKVP